MDANKTNTTDNMEDVRELAAELAKLPEAVRLKIQYVIEGARLVSEVQKAG